MPTSLKRSLSNARESTVARAMRGPVLLTMEPVAPPGGVGGDITASPVFVQLRTKFGLDLLWRVIEDRYAVAAAGFHECHAAQSGEFRGLAGGKLSEFEHLQGSHQPDLFGQFLRSKLDGLGEVLRIVQND